MVGYEKLGLTQTHFEKLEPAPAGEHRAHQHVGLLDATDADPSFDLFGGGGGIVTTAGDLIRFIRPLMLGNVFKHPATLPGALLLPDVQSGATPSHALYWRPPSSANVNAGRMGDIGACSWPIAPTSTLQS